MKGLIMVLALSSTVALMAAPYFDEVYWQIYPSLEQAATAAASNDQTAKIRAANTYFLAGIQSNSRDLLKQADDVLAPLRRRERKNVAIQSFYGMISLALAGQSNLAVKISKSTSGLSALERAQLAEPDNLEILYMYLISVWQVPTSFKNRNDKMLQFGQQWLRDYPGIVADQAISAANKERLQRYHHAVLLVLAEVENRLGMTTEARQHWQLVDPTIVKELGGDALADLYQDLKGEL